jgi:hypothetical protein
LFKISNEPNTNEIKKETGYEKVSREVQMKSQPKITFAAALAMALALLVWMAMSPVLQADEAQAKSLLKAMADYVVAQKAISFEYDSIWEVVTKDQQKLALAASGTVSMARPDKARFTRSGGFVDIEMVFDGKTLTVLGRNRNVFAQVETPGSIDHMIDELQNKYDRPLPAADLFVTGAYDELMADVVDVKDLGSGVIGGTECDYLAFRSREVDWQIWIAQGDRPYPCRYVVTTKTMASSPQYSIQIRNWKTGDDVPSADFRFTAPAKARRITLEELKKIKDAGELPSNYIMEGKQ